MSDQAQQGSGLQAVLALPGFRLLWLGQIFSQLADKFYIVLMVFLIAQNWTQTTDISSCLLYTSPSPRDMRRPRIPSSA